MEDDRRVPQRTAEEKKEEETFYFFMGGRLKEARIKAKLHQQELADKMHFSSNKMSQIERGLSKIKAYELRMLCEATGAEPGKILEYEGKGETPTDLRIRAKLAEMSEEDKEKLLETLELWMPTKKTGSRVATKKKIFSKYR